jgi:4-aminobutyrate aminotransferase-like enzyme
MTERSITDIIEARQRLLGPSLSTAYDQPLKIVRGDGQYLFDETGHRYLDAVNNVSHVGHCHPRVVEAAARQMALLNTNTRYLHDTIIDYAERLTATLPEPLNVCYFVCSGSEANELALRLAATHTGSRDMIVVGGAYHGNSSALVDISPYKFDRRGGKGASEWVHKVPMPDCYRGQFKHSDSEAGEKYAQFVDDKAQEIKSATDRAAKFICESLLGCGGQIPLPEHYWKSSFEAVRKQGGVCIADEVQVGFGRVGSNFWAFERQHVIPDIVTLGKPIGNGHPLAAVVTSREIAESFNTGMEYFNTFGGNPVSCAVGLAVLDVIKDEGLQDNALVVGSYLMDSLSTLKGKHEIVGDVRGAGLFIGVELVLDRSSLEPATDHATSVVNQMCQQGILMSTDGPLENVLKIKPPIVFNKENADQLVSTLDRILSANPAG